MKHRHILLIVTIFIMSSFIWIDKPLPQIDDNNDLNVKLELTRVRNNFIYTIINNSDKSILFNKFSGSNKQFFYLNIYNNGKNISDGCASVKYRSDDFLVKKKNYVVIKPNDKYSKIYRSYGCKEKKAKFTKIFLNLPVGEYKAIMGYSFNKNTFKRFEMYEYFKESWSGELLSDTITFEIR